MEAAVVVVGSRHRVREWVYAVGVCEFGGSETR
jgi:hypothetical protein